MAAKKRTKAELIEDVLAFEVAAFINIVNCFPEHLRGYIRDLMRIRSMTKGELERRIWLQETPGRKVYVSASNKGVSENAVTGADDPLLPIIKVADEAYGDGLVMDYYKVPTGEFGDTLASFIVREIGDAVDTSDGLTYSAHFDAAAHLMMRASEQLEGVADALATGARKIRNPDNLWERVVFSANCTANEDGTLTCPRCGGTYEECPCPGPSQEELYEYSVDDGVMYARRKVEDTRPLGKVLAERISKSVLQEMLSDEDRKAESTLMLAAAQIISQCAECGNEIDVDMCYCGICHADHNAMEQGHNFVPVGCDCGRGKPSARIKVQLPDGTEHDGVGADIYVKSVHMGESTLNVRFTHEGIIADLIEDGEVTRTFSSMYDEFVEMLR